MSESPKVNYQESAPPLGNGQILDSLPNGVALLDDSSRIRWCNPRFRAWASDAEVLGRNFYAVLGSPEILGPDFSPFGTALSTGRPTMTQLRLAEQTYLQLDVSLLNGSIPAGQCLIVVISDVSREVRQRQKVEAIHRASNRLTNLTSDTVNRRNTGERGELLKARILDATHSLLNFRVVEIRLLEPNTGRLIPWLSAGLHSENTERQLLVQQLDNGISGFVAATGKSYLCEDTLQDPMYLPGLADARSSLTVPLLLHEQVIGTFNVEGLEPGAFSHDDLLLLEMFARDVAVALNTWNVLTAQDDAAIRKNRAVVRQAAAAPIDGILEDARYLLETLLGRDPALGQRLANILHQAQTIQTLLEDESTERAGADEPSGARATMLEC